MIKLGDIIEDHKSSQGQTNSKGTNEMSFSKKETMMPRDKSDPKPEFGGRVTENIANAKFDIPKAKLNYSDSLDQDLMEEVSTFLI